VWVGRYTYIIYRHTLKHTMPTDGTREITLGQRAFAAVGGAAVSAVVVNPLEVVKTRLQIGNAASMTMKTHGTNNVHATAAAKPTMMRMFGSIVRQEGPAALWRGTSVQILNALPTVGLYLLTYDTTLKKLSKERRTLPVSVSAMPMISGITARMVAVTLSAPMENVRTMMYANTSTSSAASSASPSARDIVRREIRLGGVARLWRGYWPYFWRDVPFSAVYWTALEFTRSALLKTVRQRQTTAETTDGGDTLRRRPSKDWSDNQNSSTNLELSSSALLGVNFVSGLSAGMIAAFVTTPFDVIYVNRVTQEVSARAGDAAVGVQGKSKSAFEICTHIVRTDGFVRGLFRGVTPRVIKIAPSCAIVIASYEMFKRIIWANAS